MSTILNNDNLNGNIRVLDNLNGTLSTSGNLNGTISTGEGGGTTDYNELSNKPSINNVTLSGDKTTSDLGLFSGDYDDLTNKPTLATVATTGDYDDLTNKPTIPAAQVNSDWNSSSGVSEILNKPTFATVATTGNYNDLTNKPTIPAAQVNSDWNSSSGVSQILNKPTLATVATSGSYSDLLNVPAMNQIINLGFNNSNKVINDTELVDIRDSATTATTSSGTYNFVIWLNAYWSESAGNFYTSLKVDGTDYNATNTYAISQANGLCFFYGSITLTAGSHTFNVGGRIAYTPSKPVTIPGFTTVTIMLFKQ